MTIDPYSPLSQFIGCRFHEDYDLFGETIEEIVGDYKQSASQEEIQEICREMDEFIAEHGDNAAAVYAQNWGSFNPAGWGYTIPQFFEELKRLLNS